MVAWRRTRRVWKPNVQWVKLWSDVLECRLRLKVTTTALRAIDVKGGLDSYILDTKPAKLGKGKAMELREMLMTKIREREARGEPATWLERVASERKSSAEDEHDAGILDVESTIEEERR
jgi:ribosomal protein L28